MKRITFYFICAIFVSLPGKVLAQCQYPSISSASASNLNWQAQWMGISSDSAWQIVVVKKGISPDGSAKIYNSVVINQYRGETGYGSIYDTTVLPLNTMCYIYIRTICTPGDTSVWSPPYPIINMAQAPISNVQASSSGSGIQITWNGSMGNFFIYRYNYQTGSESYVGMAYSTTYFFDTVSSPGWYSYKVVIGSDSAFSNKVEYTLCATTFSYESGIDSVVYLYISTLNANKFFWDYGDGNFSTADTNHIHKYAKFGVFNVCLTASDTTNGCSSQYCQQIAVGKDINLIIPNFTPYADSGLLYTFYNNTSYNGSQQFDSLDFYWTFGDGKTSNEIQPDHLYVKSGKYNVCLTATQIRTKQAATICQQIVVGLTGCNLSASFGYKVTGATNDSVQFTNLSTGNIAHYNWYFDDGSVSLLKDPIHYFSKMGEHVVLLIVSDSSWNCSDYSKQTIQVGMYDCKANFEYSVGVDSTVTFNNISGGNITTYYWSFGDGIFSTDESPIHKYMNSGLYSVTLVVQNAGGTCMDKIEKEVQVGEINCNAKFSYVVDIPSLTVYCKNNAIGDATQYYWSFGDGSFSKETNPVHQYNYPGYYTIGLNTYNSLTWCMDYYETTVLVGSESIVCEPDFFYYVDPGTREVIFKDNSIGNTKNYLWDFGDNVVKPTSFDTTSHIYPHGGYYDVCLTVTNEDDVPNMTCKWIEVAPDPKTNCYADFNVSVDSVNKTASLVSQSLGDPVSFMWNLGDGTASTKKDSLVHKYVKDDYYLISLHISTASGCESNAYKPVNIGKPYTLRALFGYVPKHYNAKAGGYPVDFGGAGLGDNSRLRWNFGDGSENSTNMTPTHVYADPKKYYVCLTLADTVTHEESTVCDSVSTQTKCQNDSIDPVAKCKNISIIVPPVGTLDISPLDVNNNSTDDCGIYDFYLDNKTFSAANEGPNQIHLTVTDYNSNTSTCSAVVTVSVGTRIQSASSGVTYLTVSPNPLNNFITIRYNLPVDCEAEITIFDMVGKQVATIGSKKLTAGDQLQTYDSSELKAGSYIMQLRTSTGILNRQIIVKQ